MESSKLKLKLLVDKKAQKVLFAEAGKEVVDFIFNLLALPVGTIIKLLAEDKIVGCLGNVYSSLQILDLDFIGPHQTKATLLEPKPAACVAQVPLLLPNPSSLVHENRIHYYRCDNKSGAGCSYVSDRYGTVCPKCELPMFEKMIFVANGDGGGYVKEMVTYMVMDDLTVTPLSITSSINTLLNNVKDVDSLGVKVVDLGVDEGLAILKASFKSRTVLTEVFLKKKRI